MKYSQKTRLIIILCCLILVAVPAFPAVAEDIDWRAVARELKFEPEDIQRLEQNRILITTDRGYNQIFVTYIFSAYTNEFGSVPTFITSDSLLNAYHVLYEESILRLERANARKLPEMLRFLANTLPAVGKDLTGKPELVASAKRRAKIVVGTALRLMDENAQFPDNTVNSIIEEEVKKILAATAIEKPEWLGKPDDPRLIALDYSRYKVRGFYTQSELLQRYFRAVAWLQSIPFRVKNDEELLAILMLGNCMDSAAYEKQDEYETMLRTYNMFIGSGEYWDLSMAANEAQNLNFDLTQDGLARKKGWLLDEATEYGKKPQLNDQLRFVSVFSEQDVEPNFRIISAYRTPDDVLFQRSTDISQFQRPFPTGLEMCTALGSTFARKTLRSEEKEKLFNVIDETKNLFSCNSLYCSYLYCLAALLDEPEPDAPSFMKNTAWQAKSCNTTLGGWAQLRHTWTLQAHRYMLQAEETVTPPGFVEPEPEFFSRIANLAEQTQQILESAGAFTEYTPVVESLTRFAELLRKSKDTQDLQEMAEELPERNQWPFVLIYDCLIEYLHSFPSKEEKGSKAYVQEKLQQLKHIIANLNEGRLPEHFYLQWYIKNSEEDIKSLWQDFEKISRRLEVIAHKQLRGRDLNAEEKGFINNYGISLAHIMFYGGNSYLKPSDDAPRIADVYTNPLMGKHLIHLHIGIGRAQTLYVLYPWQGRDILCQGAILPYYEFIYDSRLTDTEWKELLDLEKHPPVSDWLTPAIWGKGIAKPETSLAE